MHYFIFHSDYFYNNKALWFILNNVELNLLQINSDQQSGQGHYVPGHGPFPVEQVKEHKDIMEYSFSNSNGTLQTSVQNCCSF